MNLRGIARQFVASVAAQGIILLQQLLLPPIFLHRYGISAYGEWLTLYAAAAYLMTLQFGMQTFVNNDLTIRYSRGERESYAVLQSTALRMLLGIALTAGILLAVVFLLPVNGLLHLNLAQRAVAWTLFLLGLQTLCYLPINYLAGTYMVFGRAHRGIVWKNWLRLGVIAGTVALAWLRVSFIAIAAMQLLITLIFVALLLIDLKRLAPDIFPTLRYWDALIARSILKPSGHFALMLSCTFLVYQLPVVLLQKLSGPVLVVVFTVMRTLFSMVRQGLYTFTNSLGPEVTQLYGREDWAGLRTLYQMSERVLFSLIPAANIGVLLLAPFLLQLWLHRPDLYSVTPYVLMTLASATMSIKEHKIQFQFSSNRHEAMARFVFWTYLVMIAASLPLILRFGLSGFLAVWWLVELAQLIYILRLNFELLSVAGGLELTPLVRIAGLVPVTVGIAAWIAPKLLHYGYPIQVGVGLATMLAVFAASAPLFQLREVAVWAWSRRPAMAVIPPMGEPPVD